MASSYSIDPLSRPSTRRTSAGSYLEGTPAISINIGAQALLLRGVGQELDTLAQDFAQPTLKRSQPKQVHAGSGFKFGGEIDVTRGCGVAARNGTEKR